MALCRTLRSEDDIGAAGSLYTTVSPSGREGKLSRAQAPKGDVLVYLQSAKDQFRCKETRAVPSLVSNWKLQKKFLKYKCARSFCLYEKS